jgi:N6-adenosine-specific RNA methylase IME4
MGDIRGLAESIAKFGLFHPVVIDSEDRLIAGRRRIEACKTLQWTSVPVTVVNIESILYGEREENAMRKDFVLSERVAIADAVAAYERKAARQREAKYRGRPSKDEAKKGGKLPPNSKGKSRDKAAQAAGSSYKTLDPARAVVEAAKAEPDKYQALQEEMDRTGKANGAYKKLNTWKQAEQIASEPPPLPGGPFRIFVIDPPWTYENRAGDTSHRAANPYPSMTIDEIKALPIGRDVGGKKDLACDDAVLWLWTTNAHLPVAFEILEEWKLTYKTMLTWVKDRMGVGDWLRGQTEHCLLAVRGKPPWNLTNQTTFLEGEVRDHSRKPEEFYKMVEALCPGSKLDMFGRAQRDGWAIFGNDTSRFS